MASINVVMSAPKDQEAWNEAYLRLTDFLETFSIGDRAHASRVALSILDRARAVHAQDTSRHPTAITMELAQKDLTEWLATNLEHKGKNPSEILAEGSIALLLSQVFRTAPGSFLAGPLPEELRQALREKLLVAGPDLNVSSMTPRPLDYGPMLQIARQTWHRWNAREMLTAIIFWACVYGILYEWISRL